MDDVRPQVCDQRLTPEQQAMVANNQGLISLVVKHSDPDFDDKWQQGVLGLIRASQKFEPEKGFRFSTYALYWIRAFVQRGLQTEGPHGRNLIRAITNGDEPPAPLFALDQPLTGDPGSASLGDQVAADVDVEAEVLDQHAIGDLLADLSVLCRDDMDRRLIALAANDHEHGWLTRAANALGTTTTTAGARLGRIRARRRHPTYITADQFRTKEPIVTITETTPPPSNGSTPSDYRCTASDCDRTFGSAHARMVHVGRTPKATTTKPKPAAKQTPPPIGSAPAEARHRIGARVHGGRR